MAAAWLSPGGGERGESVPVKLAIVYVRFGRIWRYGVLYKVRAARPKGIPSRSILELPGLPPATVPSCVKQPWGGRPHIAFVVPYNALEVGQFGVYTTGSSLGSEVAALP